ncbi:ABC transporter ATP-binding protein [Alteribacillus bidgolensis]|uniref:Carnitine transport ATP-binding protein OpuCA n=1 Tax=Alteribacillus bidgolensis TaxID=930129 RepID=A0A1G8K430_9BACI|nr:ABC transporter ATP-binding protein [Alteribacillus bidgolensis]SDI38127.1 molybdate transport system ATP-binding protein [Alteribacillus bidgolensis]
MVSCQIKKSLGNFELNVDFTMENETLVIVGHSGCGKSTTLRALSGLLTPDEGVIEVEGQVFFNKEKKINVSPEYREIGFLFQNYALFPHMTIFENVAYGLAARKLLKPEIERRVIEQLEQLNILAYADNIPAELSGGQQQRVALARALVLKPKLLLLDEPLSALDVTTRDRVRRELKKTLAELKIPAIVVTHDYEDAISLGHRIMVMDGGRVIQEGTPQELIIQPRSEFVADFSGTNYFDATYLGQTNGIGQYRLSNGNAIIQTQNVDKKGKEVSILIHPWDIRITKEKPVGKFVNVIPSKVTRILSYGNRFRVDIEGTIPLMTEIARDQMNILSDLDEGQSIYAIIENEAVQVFSHSEEEAYA